MLRQGPEYDTCACNAAGCLRPHACTDRLSAMLRPHHVYDTCDCNAAGCLPALQSLYDQVVQGIASARRLSPADVKSAVNSSPLLPSQAMQLKLLDGFAYRSVWTLYRC
jgi:hypothetical protein